ncbi:hypothetical protein L6164_024079 [Bauhinia variegata]|uniref:Uncharacterized protein n=1 Tax=Bauhinia variegata TaxID=167791 RepID=A0ACB9LWH1_BAUVA|nr:hypothetical protein L6164_024079 [Bauhinia variegata]
MTESVPCLMNQTMKVKSIAVGVPQSSLSPSHPKIDHEVRRNHVSDCCSDQLIIQNHDNFKRSAAPMRCMFYHGWSWVDFQSDVVESFRSAFREEKPMIEVIIGGSENVFDFIRMVQIDLGSGHQRSIAWIDETGKPFFPKVFLGEDWLEDSGNPQIEIDVRIHGLDVDGKRKSSALDEFDIEVNSSSKKDEEEVVSKRLRLTSAALNWPNAKLLSKKDKQYLLVSNLFLSGIRKVGHGATITAIHQWERTGPLEKARLQVFQRQNEITKAARSASNAVFAWYAAPANAVPGILAHGFGFPSKISGSPSYGIGVYLSPVGLPHLSVMQLEPDDNGEKHIILCRVILGNIEKVEAGSQQRSPSCADFDTGTDDLENPKWYVVWSANMNRHIIPECVVSFKSSTHLTGQLGARNCTKYSLSLIISKMKNRLPYSKVQELLTLYGAFKAGKLVREDFINHMRAIAGDKLIMSIIREIQSAG